MKVLLDTCILTELQKTQGINLVKIALSHIDNEDLFLSVLTIGEIAKGIALLPESRRKNDLANWLHGLENQFKDHILPINRNISFMWGELTARAKTDGITVPTCDGLIAATALYHGLHIMTRNVRHFKHTGAFIIDPGNTTAP